MVANQPKVDVNKELARADYGSVEEEQAVSEASETREENTISADRLSELESMASQYAASEDRDLVDEVSSGAYFDKHTKLYVPVRGDCECALPFALPVSVATTPLVAVKPTVGDGYKASRDACTTTVCGGLTTVGGGLTAVGDGCTRGSVGAFVSHVRHTMHTMVSHRSRFFGRPFRTALSFGG